MSELEGLDQSQYVPPNYPALMAYKSRGCIPSRQRCRQVPCFTTNHFCAEWGNSFKCICPQKRNYTNPFQGVRAELSSLDYFTRLPENPQGRYPRCYTSPRFSTMAQKYGLEDINDCPRMSPRWSPICPDNRKEFNLLHKDAVCGLCVPPERAVRLPVEGLPDCNADSRQSAEDMYDLPFRVKVGAFPQDLEKKPALPRTEISRCLQPSNFFDLQTVQRETYRDFFKIKTPNQLKYYRSPLAIDTRRPALTLPSDEDKDLVLSGPICVNALPLYMKPKGPQNISKQFRSKF